MSFEINPRDDEPADKEAYEKWEREQQLRAAEAAALREVIARKSIFLGTEKAENEWQHGYKQGVDDVMADVQVLITPDRATALERFEAKVRLEEACEWCKNSLVLDTEGREWRRKRIAELEAKVNQKSEGQ